MEDFELTPTWEQLPFDVQTALSAVINNRVMPPFALALYARWWQLETWLRSLIYVELRSRFGLDWRDNIDPQSMGRQQRDKAYEYMTSPDWDDPLAYLDASRLLALIDNHWDLFESVLPARESWLGRKAELLSIRNRIGHLRRPHRDDLRRLEQTLRDLEHGTFRAVTLYNRDLSIGFLDPADPVIAAYRTDRLPGAEELISHAESAYETTVQLSYTVRPWAEYPDEGAFASGKSGVLWHVDFLPRGRRFNVRALWNYLQPGTRKILIHLLIPDIRYTAVTFAAVDDSELVAMAIGDVLKAVLRNSEMIRDSEDMRDVDGDPLLRLSSLDSRIQIGNAWSSVDESMTPISLFGA